MTTFRFDAFAMHARFMDALRAAHDAQRAAYDAQRAAYDAQVQAARAAAASERAKLVQPTEVTFKDGRDA